MADERAETLRRRIELYRRHLRDGVDAELAQIYLEQIVKDRAALAIIEEAERRG